MVSHQHLKIDVADNTLNCSDPSLWGATNEIQRIDNSSNFSVSVNIHQESLLQSADITQTTQNQKLWPASYVCRISYEPCHQKLYQQRMYITNNSYFSRCTQPLLPKKCENSLDVAFRVLQPRLTNTDNFLYIKVLEASKSPFFATSYIVGIEFINHFVAEQRALSIHAALLQPFPDLILAD